MCAFYEISRKICRLASNQENIKNKNDRDTLSILPAKELPHSEATAEISMALQCGDLLVHLYSS